jgi:hypothetical protein
VSGPPRYRAFLTNKVALTTTRAKASEALLFRRVGSGGWKRLTFRVTHQRS